MRSMSLVPKECEDRCRELRGNLNAATSVLRSVEGAVLAAEEKVWTNHKAVFEKCFPGIIPGNWTSGSVRNAARDSVERLILEPLWRQLRARVDYAPYGAVAEHHEKRDLAKKTTMELLYIQLAHVEEVFRQCRVAETKLQKRIQRQEKEERNTGKVTLGLADSGAVQRLKAERVGIWQPCVEEGKRLHQFVTRLRAFQEQVAKNADFQEQRVTAVPAVVARAVCDFYYFECSCELEKLHLWWSRFTHFLERNAEIRSAMLENSDEAHPGSDNRVAANGASHRGEDRKNQSQTSNRVFVKNFEKTLEALDMRKHSFLKHMDFGHSEVEPTTGLEVRAFHIATTLPVVANVLSDLRRAVNRSQMSSVPMLEAAARDLVLEQKRKSGPTAFSACCTDFEAGEWLLSTVLDRSEEQRKKEKKLARNANVATTAQPMWQAPTPEAPYVLPTVIEPKSQMTLIQEQHAQSAAEAASGGRKANGSGTSNGGRGGREHHGGSAPSSGAANHLPSAQGNGHVNLELSSQQMNSKVLAAKQVQGNGGPVESKKGASSKAGTLYASPSSSPGSVGVASTSAPESNIDSAGNGSPLFQKSTRTNSNSSPSATGSIAASIVNGGSKMKGSQEPATHRGVVVGSSPAKSSRGINASLPPWRELLLDPSSSSKDDLAAEAIRRIDKIQAIFVEFPGSLKKRKLGPQSLVHKMLGASSSRDSSWQAVISWLSGQSEAVLELLDEPGDRNVAERFCNQWVAGGKGVPASALTQLHTRLAEQVQSVDVAAPDANTEDLGAMRELKGLLAFLGSPAYRHSMVHELLQAHGLFGKFSTLENKGRAMDSDLASVTSDEEVDPQTGRKRGGIPAFQEQSAGSHAFSDVLARNRPSVDGSEAPAYLLEDPNKKKARPETPPEEAQTTARSARSRPGSQAASMASLPRAPSINGTPPATPPEGATKPGFLKPRKLLEEPPPKGRPVLPPILMEELRVMNADD
ncbi:unnamed protein product [Amoebophrya sp. A25]|nr:unnamed protein product [Amoebophrya sp. A25]|eukprot:GSA25T00002216001.1